MPESEATPQLTSVSIAGVVAQSNVLFGEDFATEEDDFPEVELQVLSNEPEESSGFGVKLEISHTSPDMRISVEAVAHYAGLVPELGSIELAHLMEESALPALFPFVYEAFRNTAARLPGEQPEIPARRPHFSFSNPQEE